MDRRKTDRRDEKYGDIYVLDVQALAGVLWRRKLLALLLILIVLIPGVLYVLFRPAEYKATAAIFIGDEEASPTDFENQQPPKFDEVTMDTQQRVLTSTNLAERTVFALEKKGIDVDGTPLSAEQKDALKKSDAPKAEDTPLQNVPSEERAQKIAKIRAFISNLAVVGPARSRVITVSYVTDDPFTATEIANTHVDEYLNYLVDTRRAQAKELNVWIGEQVDTLKGELRAKSQAVQEYRKEAGIMLGNNSEDLIYQQISDISEQLVPIETQKANLQARQAALTSGGKSAINEVLSSNVVQNLKSQSSIAAQEAKSLSANLGPNHPDVLAAKKRAAQARADLSNETGTIGQSISVELAAVTEQEQLLRARLDALNKQAEDLREKEITLNSLVSEETASRTLLENFLQRYEQVKAEIDLNQSNVRVFARAEVPTSPTGVKKSLLMITIAFLSVAFGVGMVLLMELLDRGIETTDDIKKSLNMRLIGRLPRVKNPLGTMQNRKNSAYLEEIKRIYLSMASKPMPQAILFTESRRGEGKSTTVLALARYLNSVGAKTIILDTDHAAHSSCADKANIADAPGLAEYISGSADLARIVHKDDEGLSIIPPGNHAAHPVDILASDYLKRLVASLKSQYDFVFINAAPALATTDAEIIANISDQTILIVEQARVPKKHLKKVAEMLRQFSKDVPGAILTKSA